MPINKICIYTFSLHPEEPEDQPEDQPEDVIMAEECVPIPIPTSTVDDPDPVEESYEEILAKRLAKQLCRGQGGSSLLEGQIGVRNI